MTRKRKPKYIIKVADRHAGTPSRDEFAKMLIDSAHRAGMSGDIQYDANEFCLCNGGWDNLYLENAYRQYCSADHKHRVGVLQHWARAWLQSKEEIPEAFEDARNHLLPVVQTRASCELARLRMDHDGEQTCKVLHHPIGEHLVAGILYDLPNLMRRIESANLDKWGMTFCEAMQIAINNLRQLPQTFANPAPGVYVLANRDDYEASRLLLPDLFRQLRIKGDPIAIPANRHTLIVAGSDDVDGLKHILAIAQDMHRQEANPLSLIALRLHGDEWTSWLPNPDHALFHQFKRMNAESIGYDYWAQHQVLDELPDRTAFIAKYSIGRNPQTGQLTTYSAWTDGITSWLPRTENIGFAQVDENRGICDSRAYRWEQVVTVVPHLMTALNMYPARYEVVGFPTEDQFTAMGEPLIPRCTVDLPVQDQTIR